MEQPTQTNDLMNYLFTRFGTAAAADHVQHDAVRRFAEFCRSYLADNRPRATFAETDNVGVVLQDSTQLLLAPAVNVATGEMQKLPLGDQQRPPGVPQTLADAGAVPVTGYEHLRRR